MAKEWCVECGDALYHYLKEEGAPVKWRRKLKAVNDLERVREMFEGSWKVLAGKFAANFILEPIIKTVAEKIKRLPDWIHIPVKFFVAWYVWEHDEDVSIGIIVDMCEDIVLEIKKRYFKGGE